MSAHSSHSMHVTAALALAGALTAVPFVGVMTAPRLAAAAPDAGAWRSTVLASAQTPFCNWGVTSGHGQTGCSSWGIPPFPGNGAMAVALQQQPMVLHDPIPQLALVPADKPNWVEAALLGSRPQRAEQVLRGPH